MKSPYWRHVLCSSLLLLVACAVREQGTSSGEIKRHSVPILNGQNSTEDQNYAALIQTPISSLNGEFIAPNLVVTALHGVANYESGVGFFCGQGQKGPEVYSLLKLDDIRVLPGLKIPPPNKPSISKVKKIITLPISNICAGDVAFLLLEDDTDVPLTPIHLDTPPVSGTLGYSTGWGKYLPDGSGPAIRQTISGISILSVGPGEYQKPDGNLVYGLSPHQFVTNEGLCNGDSGAGFFDEKDHGLVGIASSLDNDDPTKLDSDEHPVAQCEKGALVFFIRLDSIKDLVMTAFKEAKHAPWRAGRARPAAFGASCQENLDCDSTMCITGICSRPCDVDACPSDLECVSHEATMVCARPDTTGTGGQAGQGGSNGQGGVAGQAGTSEAGGQAGASEVGGNHSMGGSSSTNLPQGAACLQASDCLSALCLNLGTESVCSAPCVTTPCEGGWECSDSNGQQVCLPPAQVKSNEDGCGISSCIAPLPSPLWLLGLVLLCRRRSQG